MFHSERLQLFLWNMSWEWSDIASQPGLCRGLVGKNEFLILTNLLHSYEMHRHNLKTYTFIGIVLDYMLHIVHSSIRGHFLLLIYPPPTKGCLRGTGSFDLYQPIPDFSAYSVSGGYTNEPILACDPCNIQESFWWRPCFYGIKNITERQTVSLFK